uniref:WGS project CBMI000000000 data, contig CS3069_c004917 n=1 Tax=Fusarium clavum TaxID=2594811 RepID=A0A090MEW4_9HYPO|nr:unnamed protein product [Fusarium clavum]
MAYVAHREGNTVIRDEESLTLAELISLSSILLSPSTLMNTSATINDFERFSVNVFDGWNSDTPIEAAALVPQRQFNHTRIQVVVIMDEEGLTLAGLCSVSSILQSLSAIVDVPATILDFERFLSSIFDGWNSDTPIEAAALLPQRVFNHTRIQVGVLSEDHPLSAQQLKNGHNEQKREHYDKAAFLRIAQGTSHMLIDISRGERPLSQLKLLQENFYPTGSSTEESSLEITLLLSPEQHDYAVRVAKIINDRKEKEIQSDPLAPYFLHAPDARTLTIGQAPTPGSEGFPTNVAGYQFTHFANADQHLLHNIASLVFRAGVVRTPHVNKDMLAVNVGGREDLYPQNGDPCQVSVEGTSLQKSSDEHGIAASAVYKALKDAEPQYDRLVYFNKNCEYVVRPLSERGGDELNRRCGLQGTHYGSLCREITSILSGSRFQS